MPLADVHAGEWRQAPERLPELDPNKNQRRQHPVLNPGHVHFWLPPFPDPCLWSAAVDPADTCCTYTIRVFLGDPDAPLLHLKTQTKSYLQGLLRRFGFNDISGTRTALLQRFQAGNYGLPFVEYRIDSRECLQRLLVVCLHAWDGPDHHDFLATMPNRGDCPWGAKRLGDLQCMRRFPIHSNIITGSFTGELQRMFRNYNHHCEKYNESWRYGALNDAGLAPNTAWHRRYHHPNPYINQVTLEALIARRLTLDDPAPYRTVGGVASEPGAVGRGLSTSRYEWDAECDDDVGGALSLAQCQLAAGDRISMKYKFGNENMIVFKVISVDRGQALLPELLFKNHTTRAHIDASGGNLSIRRTLYDEHVDISFW